MWGKSDALDRLAQALVGVAALVALGNGLFMLADPIGWYQWVDTVKGTGPANAHFIRDIGLAYLICALLMGYGAVNLPMRWGAALAGAGWLTLHGALHVWEVMQGLCAPGIFWTEAPGTLGPPLLALIGIAVQAGRMRVIAWPATAGLFLGTYRRLTWNLSPHLDDFAVAPGGLVEKLAHFMPLNTHGHAASPTMLAMARMGAVMAEDCGPCVEITARAALSQGMPRDLINAALAGTLADGPERQAYEFGRAISASDPAVDAMGDGIEATHGRAVRTELTVAAATARTHPAFKRGLGYARSCAAHPLQL